MLVDRNKASLPRCVVGVTSVTMAQSDRQTEANTRGSGRDVLTVVVVVALGRVHACVFP